MNKKGHEAKQDCDILIEFVANGLSRMKQNC